MEKEELLSIIRELSGIEDVPTQEQEEKIDKIVSACGSGGVSPEELAKEKARADKAEQDYKELKKRYTDRFWSGTENPDEKPVKRTDGDGYKPPKFTDLFG